MPEPNNGESEQDFISRCVPFIINEGTTKDPKQATAICYSLWKKHKEGSNMRKDGKVMKHLSAAFIMTDKGHVKNLKATNEDKHPTILVVGNRFMNGEFVPTSELEKVYQGWNGKYHNLNHGKNFDGKIMIQEIVGVYTNSRFADNKVMVDIIEGEKTKEYNAWKGFLALNDKADRPTNVSMELWANEKTMKFSEIKSIVDKDDKYVSKMNLTDDSDVTVLCDFEPAGGATVDMGAGGDECSHMIKNEETPITSSAVTITTYYPEPLMGTGYIFPNTTTINPVTVSMKINVDSSELDNTLEKVDKITEKEWDTAFINNLPDAAFAYIESGGTKDESGKTVPRNLRHFPHHTGSVTNGSDDSTVDLPHLRNALARAPQSPFGDKAMPHLKAHAKALNVGNYEENKDEIKIEVKEQKEVIKMAEQTIPTQQKVEMEKPNEEMVTLKKQLEELKKALTEMQAKPVITKSDSTDRDEWVGIKAINKLKQNIKTKRE